MGSLLAANRLAVSIRTRDRDTVWPVREVSLAVEPGETLALVGESGCGKSMTCLALAGLLPRRGNADDGRIAVHGQPLNTLPPSARRRHRRRHVSIVFQDATNGLNPVKTIGWQIAEAVRLRAGGTRHAARQQALTLLKRVGMPDAERRLGAFPHQLSGGMNQRAMIALAVAGGPDVLIADEATTALDVTLQAQILELISELQREAGMAVIFVTHDLGIVAQIADRVAVMYAGRIVESGDTGPLFAAPRHPYTAGLLGSLPRIDRRSESLTVLEGQVPPIHAMPPGCVFAPRCHHADDACRAAVPPLIGEGHAAACVHPLEPPMTEAA